MEDDLRRRVAQLADTQSKLAQDMCDLRGQMIRINDLNRRQLDMVADLRQKVIELAQAVSDAMKVLS